jgi:gp16 family phage-associated protein
MIIILQISANRKMSSNIYEREEVRRMFNEAGITVTDWARENGFRRADVYAVLNGRLKGSRGVGHKIFIALGLKAEPSEENFIRRTIVELSEGNLEREK